MGYITTIFVESPRIGTVLGHATRQQAHWSDNPNGLGVRRPRANKRKVGRINMGYIHCVVLVSPY